MPPLFSGPEVFFSASGRVKSFAENLSKKSNVDGSGISLPALPSRTNLKMHSISVIPRLVKKGITSLDLPKAPGPDFIPVIVLRKCVLERSYMLAEIFNICLKESCFPDCWKVLSVFPVFYITGERSTANSYHPVSSLSAVSGKT